MAVSNNFLASSLDLNGQVTLSQPTALVWGPDGRLYVTEVDGDVKVLTVQFGDPDPNDADPTAQFFVTSAVTLDGVKAIQNHNDDGTTNGGSNRQVTGIDVTAQYDENGEQVFIDGKPAVSVYVTSSDSRIGAGGDGDDANLDTNSGVITKLTQTGTDTWDAVDLVRGLARSEENHALNGLEVIQELDAGGNLVSERLIVANGGNANTGAPSNNFAGQQETAYSAAILEVDLTMLAGMDVQDDNGRAYVYDVPTLDDPAQSGATDTNDPFGGNDGFNQGKIDPNGPVQIYSPGYRNAYDVEVTEDGRVYTYDNGANNNWGGRPIGEAGDNGGTVDFAQAAGYIALNLNNGEGNGSDPINLEAWNPSNDDQFHEVTRSDDLNGRELAAGQGGAQTYTIDGVTYVYGGHPNPTRAEGSRAGLLFSPEDGADNAFLLVSDEDTANDNGISDYDEVIAWLLNVEANNSDFPTNGIYGAGNGELTKKVLAVTPGELYDIYVFSDGSGAAVLAGGAAPQGGTFLGQAGLPSDIGEVIDAANPIEGDYKEAGRTDGALDTGKGSINGLTEYTSTVLDDGNVDMSGALIAASLNGGSLIIMGRDENGVVQTTTNNGATVAADRTVLNAGGGPLGLASLGDDFAARGLTNAFQGSIWVATYKQNGPFIEIFQPNVPGIPKAGQDIVDASDADLDGVNEIEDPFEFSADNGYAIEVGQKLVLDFTQQNTNFPATFSDTGFLGAALDGVTPNQDAQTAAENFPVDQQQDGLYDNAGNIIPGGNAPTFQIKDVKTGTAVGTANSARDAMHTGIRPDPDVGRIVTTLDMVNWIPARAGAIEEGQVSGMMFGDGTQFNFMRIVMGSANGVPYLEVGYEIADVYTELARIDVPELNNASVGQLDLRFEIDIANGFAVDAQYRLAGDADFTSIPLDGGTGFSLPAGVLQDVLTGQHTIGSGANEQTSGASVGLIAEDTAADTLNAVDFNDLVIEAFGNEVETTDPAAIGAPGTAFDDTIIYTGTQDVDATLDASVENFDGSASSANVTLTANAGDNTITLGTGTNTITTGAGADVVKGTLDAVGGSEITDFSEEDSLLISDADTGTSVEYEAGSAVVIVGGQRITFSGDDFTDFTPVDGPSSFNFEDTDDGLLITRAPAESILYRINAGSGTVASIDGGPDWTGDVDLVNSTGAVSVTGNTANVYTNGLTDAEDEVDYLDAEVEGYAPWQLFVHERSDNSTANPPIQYNFDVVEGATYKITLLYVENWPGAFAPASNRVFDVTVDGVLPAEFEDLNPLGEVAEAFGQPLPASDAPDAEKQPFLGTVLTRELIYTAVDGELNLEFIHNSQNPKINAIQITQLGGGLPADTVPPTIESVTVETQVGDVDSPRDVVVVLTDARGFDAANLNTDGSELVFTGIVPDAVSAPDVVLSNGGKTATLTYSITPPQDAWPRGEGQVAIAADAFSDAAGNGSEAVTAAFFFEPNLANLVRGEVVRAINVGTTDTTPATALDPDPLDGGAVDNNRYGGAIAADSVLTDATGQAIAFEADDASYYTGAKTNGQLNNNVDGELGTTGSNAGGVDLDGSALHTYRDSASDTWTATYDGFANGSYVVELHFAELFQTASGTRVGDFFINGELVGDDYDAFVEGGGADAPSFIRHNVIVTDGKITVDVDSSAGQAGYSAIVVYDAVPSDLPPTISVSDVQVAEGEAATITVSRLGDLSEDVTVELSLADGTASGDDYGDLSTTTVVIPANSGSVTVTVPITDDDTEEPAESFTVSITGVSNASGDAVVAAGGGTATVTIEASDVSGDVPPGGAIFAFDFEAGTDPLADGLFDGALGGAGAIVAGDVSIADGKLKIQTAEGDINQGGVSSKNDLTKTVDLSDPALEDVYVTTAFDNPFTQALLEGQTTPITTGVVPNFAQQGIVLGTGTQATNELVKLVWGGVAGSGAAANGVQLWSKPSGGTGLDVKFGLEAMAPGASLFDVARVELAMGVDVDAGTVSVYVTLFDDAGEVLGGIRPQETPGFLTAAPEALPQPVIDNIASGATQIGVTSNDYLVLESFEATWDFLNVTSPQVAPADGPDAFNGTVFGDFSDDGTAPTDIGVLADGDNVLVARQVGDDDGALGRDRDFFTFEVAEGQVLTQMNLTGFENQDPTDTFGFIGIVTGDQITTDGTSPANLIGGYVYNNGDTDLLEALSLGEPVPDGQGGFIDFPGFDLPLPAGTYTVWLNQGADLPTTVTLNLKTEDAPVDATLSIADAPTLIEDGDTGTTDLGFALTLDDATFTGDLTVTFDTAETAGQSQVVSFVDGAGTLIVAVDNDDVFDGDDVVDVTLTGATGGGLAVSLGTDTASGTVTEDEPQPPVRGAVVAAFNAGGPAITQDGITFAAALSGTDGMPFADGDDFTDNGGGNGVQPAFDGTIYETEINDGGNDGSVGTFSFSSAEGIEAGKEYFVDLYFAEIYAEAVGDRVFSVFVEGEVEPTLLNYDVLANNGGDINAPVIVELAGPIAPGANGAIDLSFVASADRAKVSAIVIREAVDPNALEVSVGDVTVNEADGSVDIVIARTGNTDEDVTVTFTLTDGTAVEGEDYTAVTGTVVIPAGQGSVDVNVPILNDTVEEAAEAFTITLTGATPAGTTTATIADATATVTVLDDDLPEGAAPDADLDRDGIANAVDDDVDGDGVLNGDETFSYDATDAGQALVNGQSVTFDFETDGTPFEAGFTGALLSPNKPDAEVDLTNADVSGGTLNISVTKGDNNNSTNNQQNAFVAAFTANEGLSVETKFALPDYDSATAGDQDPINFQASGVAIGIDQDSFVKAVFGRVGGGFEVKADNAGATSAIQVAAADLPIPLADFDGVAIRLEVVPVGDPAADGWVARAFATFFDAAGVAIELPGGGTEWAIASAAGQTEIVLQDGPASNANDNSQLLSVLQSGQALGAGVIQTSVSFGGSARDGFDISYDYVTVTALGEPPAEIGLLDGPTVLETGDDGVTTLAFDVTYSGATDQTREVTYSLDGGAPQTATLSFVGGAATLTVDVANDDLADGANEVVLELLSVEGDDVIGAVATATGTVTEDDFAPTVDQGAAAQVADEDTAFTFAVPADAFADSDSVLTLTATLADDSPLPGWVTFDGTTFSGTPLQADIGTIRVKVTATDGANDPVSAEFDLTVNNVNDAPTVTPIDGGTVTETADPATIDLLSTATDEDGDIPAVAQIVSVLDDDLNPVAFTDNGDGTITVDPAQFADALSGADTATVTVTYEVTDGEAAPVQNIATLTVTGQDPARFWFLDADGDGFGSIDENDPILFQVEQPDGFVDNDLDFDDDDASINPDAPEINDGKDNDQDGLVDEENTDPEAGSDSFTVTENRTLLLSAADLTANDTDDDGDTEFTVTGVTSGTGGQAAFDAATGAVTFTPDAGFTGTATFTYDVADAFGGSASGTVEVEVTPDTGGVTETDIVIRTDAISGYWIQDKAGPDSVEVVDGSNDISLTGNTWKKVLLEQPLTIAANSELVFTFSSDDVGEIQGIGFDNNDRLNNGDAMFQLAGSQFDLSAWDQTYYSYIEGDGEVEFRIDLSAYEGQTFDYLVLTNDNDRGAPTNEANFTDIRIVTTDPDANTAPLAAADAFDMTNDAPLVLNESVLLANDTDADGDTLSISGVFNPVNGTFTRADGQITFTADPGFTGTASFDYAVSDGNGGASVATVTIDVEDPDIPDEVTQIVFGENPIESYDFRQDKSPGEGFAIDDGGDGITLTGNVWKKTALPGGTYLIDENTVLRFDMTVLTGTGEVIGIGLENDNSIKTNDDAVFQLFGSQTITYLLQSERGQYTNVGETVSYEISLADYAGQSFTTLALVNDHDVRNPTSTVQFSNVELVQPGTGTGNSKPPVIFGGALPDVTVTEDVAVEIDLPFVDPDTAYDDLSFSFDGLPDFASEVDGVIVGTPTNDDVGTYTVEVTATDPEGNAVVGSFELTVDNVNDAPVVTGGLEDATGNLNTDFTLALPDGLFTDVDAGDTLTFRAEGLPDGLSIDPDTGEISGAPTVFGAFEVEVFAADGDGVEASTTFALDISQFPPRDPVTIEFEDFTGLTESGSDLENFYVSFAAPASGSSVVRLRKTEAGTISTDLDSTGLVPGLYDLTFRFLDESDGESEIGVFLELAGGDLVSVGDFRMDQDLPGQTPFAQAANLTQFTLSAIEVPAGARLVIQAQADDGEVVRLDNVTFDPVDNARPAFDTPAAQTAVENSLVAGDVDATDPEGEAPSYAITGGADMGALTIDPATGALTFVTSPDFEAPADDDGDNVYEVTVTVSDGVTEATQDVTITVSDANEAPTITSTATASVAENQTLVATVTATDPDAGSTLTFAIGGAGADGGLFAIDPATGALSFIAAPDFETAADADGDGSYEVEVLASDGTNTVGQTVSVTVTDANDAPEAIAPVPAQSATLDAASTFTAASFFTDQDGDALTLSSVNGAPAGLTLVDGELTGTPTETGSFTVTVEATDGTETVSTTFDLVVTEEIGPFGPVAPSQNLDGDEFINSADDDVDGDGIVNADDAFSYDAGNGVLLGDGETIDLTFDEGGTPYQNGFTGLLQAATGAGNTLKPFDEETGAASVADGLLTVATTTGDTGGNNTPEDDYQVGIKNGDFTVEARVLNPFTDTAPVSFDQIGIHVGVDSTDFVKLVFGASVEFSKRSDDAETKATGGNQPLPAGLAPGGFEAVDIRLVVNSIDAGSASVTAFGTFLDANGDAIPGAANVNFGTLAIDGAMAAALADEGTAVGTGFTHVHAGSSASFDAQLDSFKVTPNTGGAAGDPGNALDAFAAQGDLDTSQTYGAGQIGSAVLEIMAGSDNIEGSNFGANSFQVTNTGDKKIAAVFIDASTALYPDSVFDPDGAGGDNASKPWAVNSDGGTGAFIGGGVGGYFLPGPDPLPNNTGTGGPSNGGYKGAMVKFNGGVNGGFQNGETVGFSGDMDPNSIAGLTKASVDGTAIDSWDVGGISGHELIGSTFTVLFDDGTTASGQLGSDGSASGSHALATQDATLGTTAPTLTVNGIGAGGLGTYGGTLPSVIVTGDPGDTVRITLTKGFNPVTETSNGIATLVENRLDAYDFKVSNTFDNQTVDVVLDATGTFDASGLFDYDDSPANNKGDGTFDGDDVAQIGFVAAVIDPANGDLPISPTTAPIYLTNEGGPVVGDPTGGTPDGYFQINNSGSGNAYFKIQIEDVNGTGGTDPGGKWTYLTAPDADGNQSGFQGSGYYLFGSETSTGIDNNVGGNEMLEYTIYIGEDDLGTYDFNFIASRDGTAAGDQQNDVWLNFKHAEDAGVGDIEEFLTGNGANEAEPVSDGFIKVFGSPNNGTWGNAANVDGLPNNFGAELNITEAGLYTIQIDGRSQGFHIDYFEFYKGSNPGGGSANSQFIEGNPTGGGGGGGGTGGGTIVTPIDFTSDDWEEFGGAGSSDLEFGANGSQLQAVGLRFDGIDIPDGAVIAEAYLQFTAFETSSGDADFTIGIEGTEDAATFSSSSPPQSRSVVDEFIWADVEDWTEGATYRTPDISELIETVIGDDGASDAAFAFIIEGTGSRAATSFNAGDAPELVIVLEDGSFLV